MNCFKLMNLCDALAKPHITDVHERSRHTYGAPRVHAELRLYMGASLRYLPK